MWSSLAGIQLYPPQILRAPLPSQTAAPAPFERAFRGGSAAGTPCALELLCSPKQALGPLSCPHTPSCTCGDIGTSMGSSATTLPLQTQSTKVKMGTPSSSPRPPLHQGCQSKTHNAWINPTEPSWVKETPISLALPCRDTFMLILLHFPLVLCTPNHD